MKSGVAGTLLRVERVMRLRLMGGTFLDILNYAEQPADPQDPGDDRPWKVKRGAIYRYIRAADDRIAQTVEKDRGKLVDLHLARRETIYARSMASSDYGSALRTLQDSAELLGLYPPKRLEHGFTDEPTAEGLLARILGGAFAAGQDADSLSSRAHQGAPSHNGNGRRHG